jgi:rhomboid protease GluP
MSEATAMRREPATPVTVLLIVANAGVYLAAGVAGGKWVALPGDLLLAWGANFGPLTAGGEWWRLATAVFLHGGIAHLAVNLWALWVGGRLTERLYGSATLLIVYLLSGLAGSIASVLWHPQGVISVGASGAVFGVFGALLAFLVTHRRAIDPRALWHVALPAIVFVIASLAFGATQPGIDNAAHLGGLAAGVAGGAWAGRRLGENLRVMPARAALLALAGAAAVATGVALVPAPPFDMRAEVRLRDEMNWLVREEPRILDAFRDVANRRRAGELDQAAMARELRERGLASWQRAADRLDAVTVDESAPSAPAFKALAEYVRLRRDAAAALVDGLERNDARQLERFQALQAEVDAARARFRDLTAEAAEPSGKAR